MLNFSKCVLMKKQTDQGWPRGWVNFERFLVNISFKRRVLATFETVFVKNKTYPDTKINPEDVASPTGYEHSTPSSIATGYTEYPKNPNQAHTVPMMNFCSLNWETWRQQDDNISGPTHINKTETIPLLTTAKTEQPRDVRHMFILVTSVNFLVLSTYRPRRKAPRTPNTIATAPHSPAKSCHIKHAETKLSWLDVDTNTVQTWQVIESDVYINIIYLAFLGSAIFNAMF